MGPKSLNNLDSKWYDLGAKHHRLNLTCNTALPNAYQQGFKDSERYNLGIYHCQLGKLPRIGLGEMYDRGFADQVGY